MRTYMQLLKRGPNFTFHLASRTKDIRTKLMYFPRKLRQQFMRSETPNVLKISLHILLFQENLPQHPVVMVEVEDRDQLNKVRHRLSSISDAIASIEETLMTPALSFNG